MHITTHESDDYSLLDLHELVLVEIGPVVDGIIATLFPGLHGKVHHLVAVSPLFDTRLIGIIVPVFGGFRRLNATLNLFIAGFNVKVQEDGVRSSSSCAPRGTYTACAQRSASFSARAACGGQGSGLWRCWQVSDVCRSCVRRNSRSK